METHISVYINTHICIDYAPVDRKWTLRLLVRVPYEMLTLNTINYSR